VKNITDGVATVLIYDEIGQSFDPVSNSYSGISGKQMASEIQMLNEFPEIKQINVRINSSGGSVIDGYSIFSAIKNSSKPVHTFIDGLGASISGIIFQAGDKRHIVDYGRLMIHDPMIGSPTSYLNDKQKRMLDSFRNSLMTILKNNSKMSLEKLDEIMSKESWIDPNDAVKMGFADAIVKTDRVIDSIMEPDEIMAICNQLYYKQKQKSKPMEKITNHLGIDLDSNETQIIEVVKTIQNDLDSAKNEIETKSNEIDTLTKNVDEQNVEIETLKTENENHVERLATMTVENAISKGIFDAENKTEMIEKCKNDIDGFKSIVDAMKTIPVKVTDKIENSSKDIPNLRELEKTNPSEVARLLNDEPETYKMMYSKQYGVEPEIN
jgi:ATP-dependent protease ClpP protease subunit